GAKIQEKLEEKNHSSERIIIPDEEDEIEEELMEFINNPEIDAVITTGGTGIAKRDKTIEVVRELFEKELPGFGEILRRIGYEKVGGPAMLTRATAGIIDDKPVFCLPGAPNSVEIAMDLILPDLGHLVKHASE
ncbi:MAG: MogA/MoaB family molybdenum cofactor biosynthesis protein, partial [Hadesarchaea archaeon]|nr:MogA/MoaB family molybdenum cofactor biosynthesis protein [Hadesarchaea archaeon]